MNRSDEPAVNPLLTVEKLNEKAHRPVVPTDNELGIDTVRMFIPVNLDLCEWDSSLWGYDSTGNSSVKNRTYHHLETVISHDFADVKVVLYPDTAIARLSFNAARLLTPKSRQLLDPDALVPLVEGVLNAVSHLVVGAFDSVDPGTGAFIRDSNWADQVGLTRLDIARNLFIDSPQEVRMTLEKLQPHKGKTIHKYWDAEGGWTLWNKTKTTGSDRLYDKAAELAAHTKDEVLGAANDGWYRFETQLEKDRIKRFGFSKLSGITRERVWQALEVRWDKCGWEEMLETVPIKERMEFLGYLEAASRHQTSLMHPPQIAKMQKLAKKLGVTPGVSLDEQGLLTRQLSLYDAKIIDLKDESR
jgi:hypothetical protein